MAWQIMRPSRSELFLGLIGILMVTSHSQRILAFQDDILVPLFRHVLAFPHSGQSPGKAKAIADWPYYRCDQQLTGRSPGKGNLRQAPVEKWRWYIGGHNGLVEVAWKKDSTTRVSITGQKQFGQSYPSEIAVNWQPAPLVDLAGNGQLVSPPPGKIGKVVPGRRGLQQVIFEPVPGLPNSGRGKCFSFEDGPNRPRLVWQTEPEREVYELLWTLGDMDGDGQAEVVFMTHYRILVYDGATGKKKSTLAWDVGRNYGQMTLVDVDGEPGLEVAVIVDSPPHVDVLKYAPGKGRLLWSDRYITDAQVLLPIDIRLYTVADGVRDLDGDGRIELIYNLYNHTGDKRWHVLIRDAATGKIRWDLPGLFLYGIADLGGPARSLCCLDASGRGMPELGTASLLDLREGKWLPSWQGGPAQWQLQAYTWPSTGYTIASLGPVASAVPRTCDVDRDGRQEVFVTLEGSRLEALGRDPAGKVVTKWSVQGPAESQLTVESASSRTGKVLVNVDAPSGKVKCTDGLATLRAWHRRGNFAPLPARPLVMAADVDGDGRMDLLVQDSHWRTRVARVAPGSAEPREWLRLPGAGLWLGRRWAGYPYSKFPVFTADLDLDGKRELILTDTGAETKATATCFGSDGRIRWRSELPDTPARGIVWMATGRFRQANKVDLLVVVQNGGLGEGFLLDGANGKPAWRRSELRLANGNPFHFGSLHPMLAVADADGDGLDDILGNTDPYLLVLRGRDGQPLVTPRMTINDLFPVFTTYGESIVGDWNATGRPSIFTNTTTGGFGLVGADLKARWFVNRLGLPQNCPGAVGRTSPHGPWLYGTAAGKKFLVYDLRTGREAGSAMLDIEATAYDSIRSADIDGDGSDEFLLAAGQRILCLGKDRSGPWQIKWSNTLDVLAGYLTIADADADGWLDILVTGTDGYVRCLGAPAVPRDRGESK